MWHFEISVYTAASRKISSLTRRTIVQRRLQNDWLQVLVFPAADDAAF